MLFRPSFDDRTLAQSFYQTLLHRFCDSFERPIQQLLDECTFGLAPSQAGEKTFLILTPSIEVAEQLTEYIDTIIANVTELMAGIEKTAICVVPPSNQEQSTSESRNLQSPPTFMMGKIFSHSSVEHP